MKKIAVLLLLVLVVLGCGMKEEAGGESIAQ